MCKCLTTALRAKTKIEINMSFSIAISCIANGLSAPPWTCSVMASFHSSKYLFSCSVTTIMSWSPAGIHRPNFVPVEE